MNPEAIKLEDESWKKLYNYIKRVPFCEMRIVFKEGKPTYGEEVKENIKFI